MGKWSFIFRKCQFSFWLFNVLLFFPILEYAQNISFGRISVEEGLSNNKVNCILQDQRGFLWFGTEDGLNRYDGYDIKLFRNDPQDPNSISDNSIWSLFEDHSGYLWIGTSNGELNRYDRETEKFVHWTVERTKNSENRINSIYEDRKKLIWIGTYKDGLYRFNPHQNIFDHWQRELENPYSLSYNYVTSILEDNKGEIWIGTYNGLNKFNPGSNEKPFTRFFHEEKNPNSLVSNMIWFLSRSNSNQNIFWIGSSGGLTKYNSAEATFSRLLFPDNRIQFGNNAGAIIEEDNRDKKILWVGTYGGLIQMDLSTGNYRRFVKEELNRYSIVSNEINYMIRDNSGVIWIGTENGISSISPKSLKFNNTAYSANGKGLDLLNSKSINAVTQTPDGTLWLGSNEGLFFKKNADEKIKAYPGLKNLNVWSLEPGNSGDLWIGTYGEGLMQLNIKTGKLKSWRLEDPSSKFKNPSYDFVKSIRRDKKGMLWVGFWGPGLTRLDPNSGEYINWQKEENNPKSLSYNDVWVIMQDNKDRIWIGTNGGGLNLYCDSLSLETHKPRGNFCCWSKDTKKTVQKNSLTDNSIYSICAAEEGKISNDETILWIGTVGGLNRFKIKNQNAFKTSSLIKNAQFEIKHFTINDGLPDNSIKSILEDEKGNLWLGTNKGLSFFNVDENTFTNFNTSDGLNGNEFNSNAAFKLSDDLLIFGSTSGLNIFSPGKIRQSDYSPPVLITGFQIFNLEVPIYRSSPLDLSISLIKEIILSHDQNVFSFQFSSLDFNSPESNLYSYFMEGFDKSWILSGSRRFVTYTNLDPGTYTFRVKGTNSDGVWSKREAYLRVIINPPWWKTTWAYALYIFLIGAGLILIRKFQINRTELRNELKIRELEAKKLQEMENLKSRFFANLSHEFRTPLMLIKGPVEQLINKWTGNPLKRKGEFEQLKMVQRNSQKLQELIDQLLELSQLESAAVPLKTKKENLSDLLLGIVSSFESLAKEREIKLIFNNSGEKIHALIDRDKLEKIMNNLLSNAFKFSSAGGSVSVSLNKLQAQAEIKIVDTGIGIAEDQLEKIFNRFYQVDDSSNKVFPGSGIGLALVKELVELHKWKIIVKSKVHQGAEFTLSIPLNDSYLDLQEQEDSKPADSAGTKILEKISYEVGSKKIDNVKIKKIQNERPLILIVEDSGDVRKYLSDLLMPCYNIIEAENGETGLKKAVEKMPDLIITDIMMPYMDGLEFCRKIKTNWETSHIPVILLTAKASTESKFEGLEMGADDYLTKPFETKELLIRIKNLLEQRRHLKEKFSAGILISTESITTTSLDKEFLSKALNLAEKNIANNNFDSETFAEEMFVSRSQLHRKLIAITGLPPGEFLRSFRLKHAAALLLEKKLSIMQIALEVGYNSPSHFSKAFHQQFGCLPSEFSAKS